jgi:hypothetical protein
MLILHEIRIDIHQFPQKRLILKNLYLDMISNNCSDFRWEEYFIKI